MKEEEIRKRDVFNEYLELVRADSEKMFSDQSQFVSIDCPACGSSRNDVEIEKYGFTYVKCIECDTLFVNPRPPVSILNDFYSNSESTSFWVNKFFLPVAEARREKIFRPRAELIAQMLPEVQNGLIGDIGAGFGLFLEEMKKIMPDARFIAIEPSFEMAGICRRKNIDVIDSMLEDIDASALKFDLLTAFELFEHLFDPRMFLQKVSELLRPGGCLILTTLNGLGFDIQVLWENSKSIFPPHHLNFFNPISLSRLLTDTGFNIIECKTPGKLDWDIVEGIYLQENKDIGRLWKTVAKYVSIKEKESLQDWISKSNMSSHMRVVARK